MAATGQCQRIDDAIAADRRPLQPIEFGVEEREIEARIVNDELGIAKKFQKAFGNVREFGLVAGLQIEDWAAIP